MHSILHRNVCLLFICFGFTPLFIRDGKKCQIYFSILSFHFLKTNKFHQFNRKQTNYFGCYNWNILLSFDAISIFVYCFLFIWFDAYETNCIQSVCVFFDDFVLFFLFNFRYNSVDRFFCEVFAAERPQLNDTAWIAMDWGQHKTKRTNAKKDTKRRSGKSRREEMCTQTNGTTTTEKKLFNHFSLSMCVQRSLCFCECLFDLFMCRL